MANSAQARKRARQAEKRRQMNASQRSMMRTYIKKTAAAIKAGEQSVAITAYQAAASALDKMARKGLIHKNKAARYKSRFNANIKAMGA